MAGAEYWIWLQKALGPASSVVCKLVEHFGDPEKLYYAGREKWLESGIVNSAQCNKLCRFSPSQSFDVMMLCLKYELDAVTPDSPFYPQQLLRIRDYPMVLYVKGNKAALNAPVLTAIVGTRKSSKGGARFTRKLGEDLAKEGVVVVSGGALGIDTAAHEGALSANGATVVVLGCGIGCDYLMQNEPMRRKAAVNGAVISEYFPETQPTKGSFPTRNRILAGMSQATVVVEAAEKSGSFITAGDALHMNRMVFAVPATASGSFYGGTDLLIREKKAYPASSASDILKMLRLQNGEWMQEYKAILNPEPPGELLDAYADPLFARKEAVQTEPKAESPVPVKPTIKKQPAAKAQPQKKQPTVPDGLEGDVLAVYNALADGSKSPDELVRITELSARQVMVAVSKLEFKGLAEKDFGQVTLK